MEIKTQHSPDSPESLEKKGKLAIIKSNNPHTNVQKPKLESSMSKDKSIGHTTVSCNNIWSRLNNFFTKRSNDKKGAKNCRIEHLKPLDSANKTFSSEHAWNKESYLTHIN